MSEPFKPYVAAEQEVAESTGRALILGVLLALVLSAANVYVGLYAGMTVSASIPAAVISMAILRGIFRRGTILENNIVQTVASTGESLAAGIIFTVPAIVLLGIWETFSYFETTLIAISGGMLGVLMMIPLRRSLVVENDELKYPEGVACGEVLIAGDKGGSDLKGIFLAMGLGGLFKVCINLFGFFKGTVEGAFRVSKTALGGGTDVSPMLAAVGLIVGWEISLLVFLGGAIAWFAAIPVLAWNADFSGGHAIDVVWSVWDTKVRFFGIGAMIVGGLWSIVKVRKGIMAGIVYAVQGLKAKSTQPAADEPRTEQNIQGKHLSILILLSVALVAAIYFLMTGNVFETGVTTVLMFILSFFFVAVASYIAGLVGSSNSPVSGMTICTILVTAGVLILLGYSGVAGMLATLGVGGVVCCAACTAGDISQDLKTGYLVGATPRRQQWAEFLGVLAPAFIIAPTMTVLHLAYGIGEPVKEGVPALKAPQAMMFKSLVSALFDPEKPMPWGLVGVGVVVGVVAVLIDHYVLEPRNAAFRLHVMPLAVGMYLPLTVSTPLLVGGLAALFIRRSTAGGSEEEQTSVVHRSVLVASGVVAGEAVLGILIALLVMLKLDLPLAATNLGAKLGGFADILSLAAFLGMVAWMVSYALKGARR
ncbi:MAG: oligopeptide transporter, OPT family [Deltaproteobacteria bacterium]|nr:oligopeptide transporter, OPT family [Deltaproteobacteria bacterium]